MERSTMNCWSTFKTHILCQLSGNCSFLKSEGCYASCCFQSYLTPQRHYDSCQLSESTTIPFRVTKILSTVGVDIPADFSFHSYQNPVNSRS